MSAAPSSTASPSNGAEEEAGGGDNYLAIYVGLPLIIAVFLAIIALLLLLVYFVMRMKAKNRASKQQYTKVSTDSPPLTNLSNLPYPSVKPPAIKIENAPSPNMSFTMAPQLPSPSSSQRYLYMKHRAQKSRTIYGQEGEKPQRSRKKKVERTRPSKAGMKTIAEELSSGHSNGSSDQGHSPAREVERSSKKQPVLSPGSCEPPTPEETFVISAAKKQVGRTSSSGDKPPEIYLTLSYLLERTTLIVNVKRVVGLPARGDGTEVDAYVRLFFIPRLPEMAQRKTSKTRTAKKESDPVFHEQICYEAMSEEELINSTLHVQVLDYRAYGRHQIIGQAEIALSQVQLGEDEESVVLQLQAPRICVSHGTVLLSMCYSTESKKLSIILLRAKDLNRGNAKETDPQAKLQVAIGDKIVGRLKTKRRSESCSPIFNEALTCSVDPDQVQKSVIMVNMLNEHKSAGKKELGNITLSSQCTGEEFRHWNDVLAQPNKHIAEWHELRQRYV